MSACSLPDEIVTTENIPTAGVRFINAVPDTNLVDMRFIDIVESNAHFRMAFRNSPVTAGGVPASTSVQYKNARAGSRKFRVFLDDTAQAVASTVLLDATYTFDAGKLYTVMMWGNARRAGFSDSLRFSIWEEAVTDPSPNVAVRLINATNAVINGRYFLSTGTAPVTATWGAVAAYTATTYVTTVPPTTGTATIVYNVRDNTDVTNLFANASALIGAASTADIDALPGTSVAGSAVTGIVFPATVAGSKAASFATPGMTFVWDRRPPRTCTLC